MGRPLYIVVLVLIIAGLVGCKDKGQAASVQPTGGDSVQQSYSNSKAIPSVQVVNPSIRSFNSDIVISGSVKADKKVTLHAMEQGFLETIHVDIGDKVSKGQAIARLSNPMLSFETKSAAVKVKEAEARLKSAQAQVTLTESDARIKQNIYQCIKDIYEKSKGLTTLTEIDNAQGAAEMAQAQQAAAIANVDRYRAEVEAAMTMQSAIAERESMLTIRAPFSGVITGRFVDPGAMVQSALANNNAMPVVSIESNKPVRLSLPLPESDVSGIKVGDQVTIDFPTMGGASIVAPISRIARNLDASSKTMEVQVDLPNKDGQIKSGMYAKANIQRASSKEILSLPNAAVLMKKDASFALQVVDGIVKEIQLKKGLAGKDFFEVMNADLSTKSQIIVKGKSSVKAGQKVNAVLK